MGKRTACAGPEQLPSTEKGQPPQRFAALLLDQQMWCWGNDVRRTEGNLLLQFGFRRKRPPAGVRGCSAYVLTPLPGCEMVLWGFGVFFGLASSGGLFLRRYEFNPLWTELPSLPEMAWDLEPLPPFRPPHSPRERGCTRRLLKATACWIASYEQWVLDTAGIEYRQSCLRQWPRTVIPVELVPEHWQRLAESCEEFLTGADPNYQ